MLERHAQGLEFMRFRAILPLTTRFVRAADPAEAPPDAPYRRAHELEAHRARGWPNFDSAYRRAALEAVALT